MGNRNFDKVKTKKTERPLENSGYNWDERGLLIKRRRLDTIMTQITMESTLFSWRSWGREWRPKEPKPLAPPRTKGV